MLLSIDSLVDIVRTALLSLLPRLSPPCVFVNFDFIVSSMKSFYFWHYFLCFPSGLFRLSKILGSLFRYDIHVHAAVIHDNVELFHGDKMVELLLGSKQHTLPYNFLFFLTGHGPC